MQIMVWYTANTWVFGEDHDQGQGQPGVHGKTLSQKNVEDPPVVQ